MRIGPAWGSPRPRRAKPRRPRSLAKYRYLPSGDHAGLQSRAGPLVSATGSPVHRHGGYVALPLPIFAFLCGHYAADMPGIRPVSHPAPRPSFAHQVGFHLSPHSAARPLASGMLSWRGARFLVTIDPASGARYAPRFQRHCNKGTWLNAGPIFVGENIFAGDLSRQPKRGA